MDCRCSDYDPSIFGEQYSVTRHRGRSRPVSVEKFDEVMLLSSWKYFASLGMEDPFKRGKKEISTLIAEPELRSQIQVPRPAIESVAAVVVTVPRKAEKPRRRNGRDINPIF